MGFSFDLQGRTCELSSELQKKEEKKQRQPPLEPRGGGGTLAASTWLRRLQSLPPSFPKRNLTRTCVFFFQPDHPDYHTLHTYLKCFFLFDIFVQILFFSRLSGSESAEIRVRSSVFYFMPKHADATFFFLSLLIFLFPLLLSLPFFSPFRLIPNLNSKCMD